MDPSFEFNAPMFTDFYNIDNTSADPDSFFFPKGEEAQPETQGSHLEGTSCSRSRSRSSARRTSEVLNEINREEILNQAIENLTVSAKKIKKTPRKSVFGGIQLDPAITGAQSKEHPMVTRLDKVLRTPKLELRTRSVVKNSLENEMNEAGSRKRKSIYSHVPAPFNLESGEESASATSNEVDCFDLAIPAVKKEKLSPAVTESFVNSYSTRKTVQFTDVKYEPQRLSVAATDSKAPYNFSAKPNGPSVNPGARKRLMLTEPKTPQFRSARRALRPNKGAHVITNVGGVNTVKFQNVFHSGVPCNVKPNQFKTGNQTQVKPFSFEERDKRMLERKEQKIKEMLEEERRKAMFHANPVPPFIAGKKEIPIPSTRGYTLSRQSILHKYEQSEKENPTSFKAQPPTVLHKEPFIPKKADRPLLEITDFELKTEKRAREREQFELHMKEREAQMELAVREREEQEKKREEEEIARMRREAVHKANPVPKYLPPKRIVSFKPLTEPMSPKFSSRFKRQ